ncbi:MAG TPA: Uma2 family endonuclease [Pyrinomonadaceae bacterium]|nr:Uma2 family endonuclease [Pyrinomonadaceae bacterium]
MSTTIALTNGLVVDFSPLAAKVSDEEFDELCRLNPELQLERTSQGELVIMAPTGGKTGRRNAKLIARVINWAEQNGTGQVFDSSTVFLTTKRRETFTRRVMGTKPAMECAQR